MIPPAPVEGTVVVMGFGVTGEAVVRHLIAEGNSVVVIEDRPTPARQEQAAALGVTLRVSPAPPEVAELIRGVALMVPSPGVPVTHPVLSAAAVAGVPVLSEVELAWRRSSRPIVAVTGTNGKTTVTTLVQAMLEASGVHAVAAGNIGEPLIDAVDAVDPPGEPGEGPDGPGDGPGVIVAELSSFQLHFTDRFRPRVSVWLNLSEDHLDWHPDLIHYAAAKARVWANQGPGDVAIVNADDPAVMAAASTVPAGVKVVTFGCGGDWRVSGDALVGPDGITVARTGEMPRALPHDLANALAAVAAATAAGASPQACRRVLTRFRGLPHRVELIGEAGGVRYYDDSKATTPASVLAALAGLDSVVLIAGGRNKSLDLSVLARGAAHLRSVVALGEAAAEVRAAFEGVRPVAVASTMEEAVRTARDLARPGDTVLLSPGCASFDMYPNYAARGEHYASLVRELTEVGS